MGNNQNNTVIEYWTKTGIRVSYLFWDLKGKNRFSEPPSDLEVSVMFEKCLKETNISSYQLSTVREFTPKYKYRFILLHNRKIAEHIKQEQMQKHSRESYYLQVAETVKTIESQKKMFEVQSLIKSVQLNESSIKTSLVNVDKFISEMCAQNEFLEVRGIERFLELLNSATKINNMGAKTSFASQIQLLKFFRYFSLKYNKEFYSYLPRVKSYPHTILKTYHPINTQIIAYSLNLLSEYSWRVEDDTTLINILQKNRISLSMDSFLSPFIQSIIQSDSIISVYHNIKFVNDLMSSALTKSDKEILEQNLFNTKYSLVLQNVKIKLETMQYSIQKTTFISVYQKIFKYSFQKQNNKDQKQKIHAILEQNSRQSTTFNNRSSYSLQILHEQAIAKLIKIQSQQTLDSDEQTQDQQDLPTYLTENDRRQFNKVIFDILTEMQKFYKLQFYLQTIEDQGIDLEFNKAKQLIDSRIVQHNLETYFSKIKQQCQQNKCTQVLNNFFKKVHFYGVKQWQELEKFVYEEPQQRKKVFQELQELKIVVEDKKSRIKTLIKEINELKAKNQYLTQNLSIKSQENLNQLPFPLLKPPPDLQSSLRLSQSTNLSENGSVNFFQIIPPFPLNFSTIPLPTIPLLLLPGLGNLNQENKKQKRKPLKTLKTCNYTTISYEKIKNSIFEEIDDTKVQLNEDQLVQLFAKNTPQQNTPLKRTESIQSTYLSESRINLSPSMKQTIKLLKSDRQKNIQIVLVKLKLPKRQMKKVLNQCSGKFTSQHTLEVIEKLLPSEEQEQMLNAFDGNQQDLGVSERFIKDLIQVPEYANRIKSLIFSHVKQEIYFEIQSKTKKLQQAFISLRTNNRLKYIIQYCLAIGNYLNGQNVKGGAWGFKLETIQRLEEVKCADKNMNGALYLIKQVWKQFNYPIFDRIELQLYQNISKMPISQIKHEIDELQKYIIAIEKACNSKDPQNPSDKILEFCENFRNQAIKKLDEFKLSYEQLKDSYIRCAQYFCEDGKIFSSDEFGKKMYQCVLFVANTQKIWKVISQKNAKIQRHRAVVNSVAYNQYVNPEKNRESVIDLRLSTFELEGHENLSKTMPNMLQQKQFQQSNSNIIKNIQTDTRQSRRISSILEIHKPLKPLEQLNEDERQKQLHQIQQESVNRAMQDVFRRRTIRFQNISVRFSKVNGVSNDVNPQTFNGISAVQNIPFLKQVDQEN